MLSADEVAAAIKYRSDLYVAEQFGVSDRTVRRWLKSGCPLRYGKHHRVTREVWERFARFGDTGLVDVAGDVSSRSSGRTGHDRDLSKPSTPRTVRRPKRKRLRLSRELIRARGGKGAKR